MGRPHLPPPPMLDPAWYPDPTGRYEARYWDGRHWTSHISHYGATGADPLLRARMDHFWIRSALKVAMWGALALGIYWAYDNYWPSDDRDLTADEGILEGASLVRSDTPAGFTAATLTPLSLLTAEVEEDDDGAAVTPEACAPLEPTITDASDEPNDSNAFAGELGETVGNVVIVGADDAFARSYLDAMRSEDAGACIAAIWADRVLSGRPNATLSSIVARSMTEPAFGDNAVWWRLTGTIEGGGFPLEIFSDLIVVRVGRSVSEYDFEAIAGALGVDVHRDTIRPHITRLRDAIERADGVDDDTDEDTPGDADDTDTDETDDGTG